MAATYKDIQKETGLSLSTISKYFNGGKMRDKNRKAIEKAIQKLDFRVNEFARGLKSRRSHTIGVLIPELISTFHTAIIADMEEYLRANGYGIIICDCHLDRERERDALTFLLDKMVDGIITVPYDKRGEHLALARQREVPVVLIDRLASEFKTDAVITDNESAGELAVGELAAAGHRRLAILSGPDGIYTMNRRMEGFVQALQRHALPVDSELLMTTEMTAEGGYNGLRRLMERPDPPTGLFCANYEITLGAVIALNEMGIHIPDQLSLIGMDNLMLSQLVHPKLTLVMQPMQLIAQSAAQLMLDRLQGSVQAASSRTVEFPLTLVRGDSVQPPALV